MQTESLHPKTVLFWHRVMKVTIHSLMLTHKTCFSPKGVLTAQPVFGCPLGAPCCLSDTTMAGYLIPHVWHAFA